METFVGRLTADAKTNKVNESEVVNFSIARNRTYKNQKGEKIEDTLFINCGFWKTTKIAPYLLKGSVVEVSGHLSMKEYTSKEGKERQSLYLHTNEINFHSPKKNDDAPKGGKKKGGKKREEIAEPAADDLPF